MSDFDKSPDAVLCVQKAYAAARESLYAFAEYCRAMDEAYAAHCHATVTRKHREAMEEAAHRIDSAMRVAEAAFDPARRHIHAVCPEVVSRDSLHAPSFAQLTCKMAREIRTVAPSLKFMIEESEHIRLRGPFSVSDREEDIEFVAAALDLEESRALALLLEDRPVRREDRPGYWRWDGGKVYLEGPLNQLRGRSRQLVRHLIIHEGREVTYQDLADEVWGDPDTKDSTIHTAVSKLRRELGSRGLKDLAAEIHSLAGAYQLVRRTSR